MKRLLGIFLLLLGGSAAWANIQALNFQTLGKYDLIVPDLGYLQANSGMFDHWSAQWPYDAPKDECLKLLKAASARIEALREKVPTDVELSLLLLVVYQYRYNLDDNQIHVQFEQLAGATETRFPDDYRPIWFEAVFLSNGGKPIKAVEKFQLILNDRSALTQVHPAILLDYAFACYTATMLRTAKIAVQTYVRQTGFSKEQVSFLRMVEEVVQQPEIGGEYQPQEIWTLSKVGADVRFYSSMLSTAFSLPGEWKPQLLGYKNFQSVCILTPPPIRSKLGKNITINLVLIQSTRQQPFSQFVAGFEQSLDKGYRFTAVPMKLPASENRAADRVTNPALYPDRNGMAGYAVFLANSPRDDSGFNLDTPNNPPPSESAFTYYRLHRQYDRFAVGINTVLFVDSCQEIADETDALVNDFLETLQVD